MAKRQSTPMADVKREEMRMRSLRDFAPLDGHLLWDQAVDLVCTTKFGDAWHTNRLVSKLPFSVGLLRGAGLLPIKKRAVLRRQSLEWTGDGAKVSSTEQALASQNVKAAKAALEMYQAGAEWLLSALASPKISYVVLSPAGHEQSKSVPNELWTAQRRNITVGGQVAMPGKKEPLWQLHIEKRSLAASLSNGGATVVAKAKRRSTATPSKVREHGTLEPGAINPDALYSTEQAAKLTGYSVKSFEGWRAKETGPKFVRANGGRAVRYVGQALLDHFNIPSGD